MMNNFMKTFVRGFALSLAIYPQVFASCPNGQIEDSTTGHCLKTYSDCDGKCTAYYDTVTHAMTIKKNSNVEQNADVVLNGYTTTKFNPIVNVTIEEGITGMSGPNGYYFFNNCSGTLTLPSTIKNVTGGQIWNAGFTTIDASKMTNTNLSIPKDGNNNSKYNLIIDSDSNMNIWVSGAYGASYATINIICKGINKVKCENMVTIPNTMKKTSEYYVSYDSDGRLVEEWGPNGKSEYTYKFDRAGNLTASYKNGIATYKRTSYTPKEAAAAANRGNNNTVTLTFK